MGCKSKKKESREKVLLRGGKKGEGVIKRRKVGSQSHCEVGIRESG